MMIKTLKSIINNLNSKRDDLIVDCLRKISKKSTLDDTDREFLEYLANSIEKERNQPVKHGKWIICSDGYYPYCSECRCEPKSREMTKYCAECGAKMDKKEATYIKDIFMTR